MNLDPCCSPTQNAECRLKQPAKEQLLIFGLETAPPAKTTLSGPRSWNTMPEMMLLKQRSIMWHYKPNVVQWLTSAKEEERAVSKSPN